MSPKIILTEFAVVIAFDLWIIPRSPKTSQPNLYPSGVSYEMELPEGVNITASKGLLNPLGSTLCDLSQNQKLTIF